MTKKQDASRRPITALCHIMFTETVTDQRHDSD